MINLSGERIAVLFENGAEASFDAAMKQLKLDESAVHRPKNSAKLARAVENEHMALQAVVTDVKDPFAEGVLDALASDIPVFCIAGKDDSVNVQEGMTVVRYDPSIPSTLAKGLEAAGIHPYFEAQQAAEELPLTVMQWYQMTKSPNAELGKMPSVVECGLANLYVSEPGRKVQAVSKAPLEQIARGVAKFQDDFGKAHSMKIRRPLFRGDSLCKLMLQKDGGQTLDVSMLPLVATKDDLKEYGIFVYGCALAAEMNNPTDSNTKTAIYNRLEPANAALGIARANYRQLLQMAAERVQQ